ncbi:MAG: hypothetical protein OHK0015_36110 [Chloroflexi bacterium OHK40]
MGLIKPGLWHQEPEPPPQSAEHSGPTGRPAHPSGRRSPLRARTTALLHRLRAHPPERSSHAAADLSADALCPVAGDDADLNRVQLTGVLGSEPLLYDVGDHPVATLALACQRRWRAASGAVQLATTWFNLSAWEELAEQCGRQLHRGDRVYVEGYLHLWTETRPPQSYACHTIVLDRIVLLAAGQGAAEGGEGHP